MGKGFPLVCVGRPPSRDDVPSVAAIQGQARGPDVAQTSILSRPQIMQGLRQNMPVQATRAYFVCIKPQILPFR